VNNLWVICVKGDIRAGWSLVPIRWERYYALASEGAVLPSSGDLLHVVDP
jgi:hypothetical protein